MNNLPSGKKVQKDKQEAQQSSNVAGPKPTKQKRKRAQGEEADSESNIEISGVQQDTDTHVPSQHAGE